MTFMNVITAAYPAAHGEFSEDVSLRLGERQRQRLASSIRAATALSMSGRGRPARYSALIRSRISPAMKDDGDLPRDCDLRLLHADPLDQPRAPGVPIVNQIRVY